MNVNCHHRARGLNDRPHWLAFQSCLTATFICVNLFLTDVLAFIFNSISLYYHSFSVYVYFSFNHDYVAGP